MAWRELGDTPLRWIYYGWRCSPVLICSLTPRSSPLVGEGSYAAAVLPPLTRGYTFIDFLMDGGEGKMR